MNWNRWIRQTHRWLGAFFTVTVIANIVAMSMQPDRQPDWITYSPLAPLGLLWCSGVYLFVLPYAAKRRGGQRVEV